jgi:glycosyltransferase involved in cell wall biosynthesis
MNVRILGFQNGIGGGVTWSKGLLESLRKFGVKASSINVYDLLTWPARAKCDVVHFCTTAPSITSLMLVHRLLGSKIVFTLHGDYRREFRMTMSSSKLISYMKAWDISLKIANATTTPSDYLKERYGTDMVIPNGIDFAKFNEAMPLDSMLVGSSDCNFKVLSVYNLDSPWRVKDVLYTIRIFRQFNRINHKSHLMIAGGGQFLSFFERTIGASPDIHLLGQVADMPSLYKAANVLLHVSSLDNSPYSILEAMASSLPIIASKVGGIPELVAHEKSGFLIDYGNSWEYVSALEELYEDFGKRQEMGLVAQTKAEDHDWSRIAPMFVNLYNNI